MSPIVGSRQAESISACCLHEVWKSDKLWLPWKMMSRWKFRAESSETVYCCRWGANSHASLRTNIALLNSTSGMKSGSPPQPINTWWELQPWENLFSMLEPTQSSPVWVAGDTTCPSATLQHYCKDKPEPCSQESCSTFWRHIWECK